MFNELNKFRKYDHVRANRGTFNHTEVQPPASATPIAPSVPAVLLKAEIALLELALSHGTYGKQLAEALPHSMISKTPVGNALNTVISMTLNDEWEFAEDHIRTMLTEQPCPEISKMLTIPEFEEENSEKQHEKYEKVFTDCLATIINYHRKMEINNLTLKLSTAQGEEKQQILKELQEKKRAMTTNRKRG